MNYRPHREVHTRAGAHMVCLIAGESTFHPPALSLYLSPGWLAYVLISAGQYDEDRTFGALELAAAGARFASAGPSHFRNLSSFEAILASSFSAKRSAYRSSRLRSEQGMVNHFRCWWIPSDTIFSLGRLKH